MIALAPRSRAEMDAAHKAARAQAPDPAPEARNLEPVIRFGDLEYFTFRGRAFGVPPVPWKRGLELLAIMAEARAQVGRALDPVGAARYALLVEKLARLLWRCTRPAGLHRRILRRLGLLRNPFLDATEGEIGALAGFFLSRRTRSHIGFPPAEPLPLPTS